MSYQDEIRRLEKLAREEDCARRKEQSAAWKALAAKRENWEWRIEEQVRQSFDRETLEGLLVSKRLREEVLAGWKKNGPATLMGDGEDGKWQRMFYYRTEEGILYHEGGGYLVLKDVQLCSDEQWAELTAGRIPDKFRNGR